MRYQSLDMNLLAALEALLTERSVGGAAARMNMTQPGMSNALSRLREHFGDQLLVRVGNRMTMTPVAEALRPELQDILRRVRDFATPSQFDPAGTHRTIQILVEEYVPGWRLARFAAKLRETAPHLVLKIYTSRDDAADRLMRGDADLLIASPRVTVAGMPRLLLYEDGFTCVVGPHHPSAASAWTLRPIWTRTTSSCSTAMATRISWARSASTAVCPPLSPMSPCSWNLFALARPSPPCSGACWTDLTALAIFADSNRRSNFRAWRSSCNGMRGQGPIRWFVGYATCYGRPAELGLAGQRPRMI
jgi:DNA-binding transcriptional LysR family regulator